MQLGSCLAAQCNDHAIAHRNVYESRDVQAGTIITLVARIGDHESFTWGSVRVPDCALRRSAGAGRSGDSAINWAWSFRALAIPRAVDYTEITCLQPAPKLFILDKLGAS
jgi:hypothetical protein